MISQDSKRVLKSIVVVVAVALSGLFVWDYFVANPWGPSVRYRLKLESGQSTALVHLGEPDAGDWFNGDNGYVWEVRPVQIDEHGAVLDVRIMKLKQNNGFDAARKELKGVETLRFTIPQGGSIRVPVQGGEPAVLTNLPF